MKLKLSTEITNYYSNSATDFNNQSSPEKLIYLWLETSFVLVTLFALSINGAVFVLTLLEGGFYRALLGSLRALSSIGPYCLYLLVLLSILLFTIDFLWSTFRLSSSYRIAFLRMIRGYIYTQPLLIAIFTIQIFGLASIFVMTLGTILDFSININDIENMHSFFIAFICSVNGISTLMFMALIFNCCLSPNSGNFNRGSLLSDLFLWICIHLCSGFIAVTALMGS